MIPTNRTEAAAEILDRYKNGRLLRREWTQGKCGTDGHERACLLAAIAPCIAPDGGRCQPDFSACPAWLLPQWMAYLTPWIDDAGSLDKWGDVVQRYAANLRDSDSMTPQAWDRLRERCRCLANAAGAPIKTALDWAESAVVSAMPNAVEAQETEDVAYESPNAGLDTADRLIDGVLTAWREEIDAAKGGVE